MSRFSSSFQLALAVIMLVLVACIARKPNLVQTKNLQGEWFTSNDDSLFFKADTLMVLKRSDNNLVLDKMCVSPNMAREQGLLNCMEFVNLRLKRRGRFEMWLYEGYTSEIWLKPMKWKLDNDTLMIVSEDFSWNYMIVKMDTVRLFDDKHSYYDRYANPRMTLQRIPTDAIYIPTQDSVPAEQRSSQDDSEPIDTLRLKNQEYILRNLIPVESP